MSHLLEPIDDETPIDPSGLLDRTIKTRSQLNQVEAENIRRATVKYLAAQPSARSAPFTYPWAVQVHRELFGDVWTWAGQIRAEDLNLGVPWQNVISQLEGLFLDIGQWQSSDALLLEQTVTIHYRAVAIHPFYGGNGRWSRFLANVWLKRHGKQVIEWPEAEVGRSASSIRSEYIAAIKSADRHDFGPLMQLHERYWKATNTESG